MKNTTETTFGDWEPHLSPRQREVALLVSQGLSNAEIAAGIGISQSTTIHHLGVVFGKLRVRNRAELTRFICEGGLDAGTD